MRTKHFIRLAADNGSARNGSGANRRLKLSLLATIFLLCSNTILMAQTATDEPVVLLQTPQWGQQWPLNAQVPVLEGERACAGCVPIAYGIIMKYWEWPPAGQGYTKPYTSYKNGWTAEIEARNIEKPYDWSSMSLSYKTPGNYEEAARLIADVGALAQTNYGLRPIGSSASGDDMPMKLMKHYLYKDSYKILIRKKYNKSDWYQLIRKELDAGRPVFYTAKDKGSGHAFIIDGYDNENRFHLNLGWGGDYNGWYSLDSLKIAGKVYDSEHHMICGIEPDKQVYTDVCKENRIKYMKNVLLVFQQEKVECFGKDCITIRHPKGAVVTVKVDGIVNLDIVHELFDETIISIHDYPGELYEITVMVGPYKKVFYFKYKNE